jgi:AAHS family 4-hydroxybenzoate transporter-like MFS transporter
MSDSIDVARLIDSRPVSRFQWQVLATCMAVSFLDGLNLQTIGVAAPALAALWGIARQALGPVFAAAPAGMILGALLMGPIADRIGRKRLVVMATVTFGLFSLLTPLATTLHQLLIFRLLTGLGLGGALPNLISLITEYSPAPKRGFLTALTFSSLPFGSMLAGLVGPWMIPAFGWQSVFYFSGAAPVLVAVIALLWLPESIRYLANHPERRAEVLVILRRIAPDIIVDSEAPLILSGPPVARRILVSRVFGPTRTSATLTLALIVGLNLFMINLLVNWLPTLLGEAGMSRRGAILSTAVLNVMGAIGGIAWGSLLDRFGMYRIMGLAALASGVAMVGLAFGHTNPTVMFLTLSIVGLSVMGTQPGFYTLIASVYPTSIRSTGVGTSLGIGRLGSVFGPALGGMLVAAGLGAQGIFLVVACAGILCSLAVWVLSRLRPQFS